MKAENQTNSIQNAIKRVHHHHHHHHILFPKQKQSWLLAGKGAALKERARQWRRLHGARGDTCLHFYKWLGTDGTVSRRTANKKLTKLYWPPRKRSPKRLIILVESTKSGGARPKKEEGLGEGRGGVVKRVGSLGLLSLSTQSCRRVYSV